MKLFPMLAVLPLLAVSLAGCGDGGGSGPTTGPPPLSGGKGAITGLLLDDAFRPLRLTDSPQGEYDFEGILLLQEAGLTTQSSADGVFTFSGLEPGSYTLRADVDAHEAAPLVVDVRAGEYTEIDVVARRIESDGPRIITTEYNVFISCAVDFVANGIVYDCTADQSGDSDRADFISNYTGYKDATYLVTEMRTDNEDRYEVQVRSSSCPADATGGLYGVSQFEGDYTKIIMPFNGTSEQSAELSYGPNSVWDNQCEIQTILFSDSVGREELQENGVPVCCGAGAHFGIKAKFVQSLFIGPPEEDINTYAVLA